MTFNPNTRHCTTCNVENPETDEDGETTCCLDTVCDVDADGRCYRCNPLCALCGFEITEGFEIDARGRQIHPERRCTAALDAASAAVKKAAKPAVKPARKLAESAGLVAPVKRSSGSHAACEHEATKSARAACRKRNAAK